MTFDPIPDSFAPSSLAPASGPEPEEARAEEPVAEHPRDAERALTHALSVLKRKGTRVAARVEAVVVPGKVVAGAALVFGLGALLVYAVVRARRPRRRMTIARAITRSLGQEIAGRVLLGAAATVGARLADAVLVPMIVQGLSARALAAEEQGSRPRKSRATPTAASAPSNGARARSSR